MEIIGQTNGKNGSKLKKRSKVSQSKSGGKNGDNLMLSTTDEKSLDQSLGPDPEGSKHILLPKGNKPSCEFIEIINYLCYKYLKFFLF